MGKEPQQGKRSAGIVGVASAVALLLGVLAVQALPALPPRWPDAVLAFVALAAFSQPRLRLLACILIGFAWCAFRADIALQNRLPRNLEGRDFDIIGVIDDLPLQRPDATRFSLRIERVKLDGADVPLHGSVRLSWYNDVPDAFGACTRWQLRVRLKRPRGLVNRGGFDSERQALERGIVAVGYVRDAESNRHVDDKPICVDRLRERTRMTGKSRALTAFRTSLRFPASMSVSPPGWVRCSSMRCGGCGRVWACALHSRWRRRRRRWSPPCCTASSPAAACRRCARW